MSCGANEAYARALGTRIEPITDIRSIRLFVEIHFGWEERSIIHLNYTT